uniref:Uncharacterized protein n=1 Tax=Lepeophtheirus salmonis TaxID=72036 RepID=A0A0K2UF07_LEPSM
MMSAFSWSFVVYQTPEGFLLRSPKIPKCKRFFFQACSGGFCNEYHVLVDQKVSTLTRSYPCFTKWCTLIVLPSNSRARSLTVTLPLLPSMVPLKASANCFGLDLDLMEPFSVPLTDTQYKVQRLQPSTL